MGSEGDTRKECNHFRCSHGLYRHNRSITALYSCCHGVCTVSTHNRSITALYSCCHGVCTVSAHNRSITALYSCCHGVCTVSTHSFYSCCHGVCTVSTQSVSTAVVTESVQYPHSQFLQLLSRSLYPRGSGVCDLLHGPQRKHGPPDKSTDHQTKAGTTRQKHGPPAKART